MTFGITGTRNGMTAAQKQHVHLMLSSGLLAPAPRVFVHGDCIGADQQAAVMAQELGYHTVALPGFNPRDPANTGNRAFHLSDEVHPPQAFLVRDRQIVDLADLMLATPAQEQEVMRSGTWATVRYARKVRRKLLLILPSGKVIEEHM